MSNSEASSTNWQLTAHDLEKIRDKKEKETGVFHWKNKDGSYKPITNMSEEELEHAEEVCTKRLDDLNSKYEGAIKDREHINSNIRYLQRQIKSWAYREEKIYNALYEMREGVSKEAVEGNKEIVD